MTDGLVIVDKPAGITSHDVVARVRRLLGTRKVGHAGTLDPMATGVLVLGVGRATRLLGHLMLTEKSYDATVRFGVTTVTDDAEGDVLETRATDHLTDQVVRDTLAGFVGEIDQVPTAVSAVKVDGRRAYQRVRDGEDVELAPRRVTVHELDVREVRLPEASFSLRCTSGTYVRAIARDAGAALGVGGHLVRLRRTAVGPFGLADAVTVDDPRESDAVPPPVLPIAAAARSAFPALDLDDDAAAAVRFGRPLAVPLAATTAVFDPAGEFLALYRPDGAGSRPLAVFVGS